MTWRFPGRAARTSGEGSRGTSGIYGLGELPGATINQNVGASTIGASDVAIYDRLAIRRAANGYRADESRKAWFLAKNLQMNKCIGGLSVLDPSILKACGKYIGPERLLLPLGVAEMCRYPFSASELLSTGEDGSITRTYTPTWEQSFEASLRAYLTSQMGLLDLAGVVPPDNIAFEDYVVSDAFLKAIGTAFKGSINSLLEGSSRGVMHMTPVGQVAVPIQPGFWVSAAAKRRNQVNTVSGTNTPLVGDVCTVNCMADGMAFYSILPTQEELEEDGGLLKFYKRGGWIMSKAVLDGKIAIQQNKLNFNNGYFQCPDGKIGAAVQDVPDEGHGWLAFVKFGRQYTITIKMKDRTTWESVKHAVGGALSDGFKLICKAAPLAQSMAQQIGSMKNCTKLSTPSNPTNDQKKAAGCTPLEIAASPGTTPANACLAKLGTNTPCNAGEPNCHCSPVVGTQYQMAAAAGATLLQYACQPGAANAPITCDQLQQPSGWPTWLLVGTGIAAAVAGARLFIKKR